jgi:hypothetical protein
MFWDMRFVIWGVVGGTFPGAAPDYPGKGKPGR